MLLKQPIHHFPSTPTFFNPTLFINAAPVFMTCSKGSVQYRVYSPPRPAVILSTRFRLDGRLA